MTKEELREKLDKLMNDHQLASKSSYKSVGEFRKDKFWELAQIAKYALNLLEKKED